LLKLGLPSIATHLRLSVLPLKLTKSM